MDINIYPKCKELLRKDTIEALKIFLASFPVEAGFEKDFITDELIDSSQKAIVENNPRHLFDFFDKNGIEIEIYKGWKFNIDMEYDEEYKTRSECEKAAFTKAFEKLESTL